MDPVLNYTEDSGLVSLIPETLQGGFFFTATEGFNIGYRVTLSIIDDVLGELVLPNGFSQPDVTITGQNTSRLTVSSMFLPNSSDSVPVNSFTAVFRAVKILFRDQAPRRYLNSLYFMKL